MHPESITRDLTGRAIEIGHLEGFVAVFRVAHPAPRVRRFPYLFDVIENELGIGVECTAQTIEISVK